MKIAKVEERQKKRRACQRPQSKVTSPSLPSPLSYISSNSVSLSREGQSVATVQMRVTACVVGIDRRDERQRYLREGGEMQSSISNNETFPSRTPVHQMTGISSFSRPLSLSLCLSLPASRG